MISFAASAAMLVAAWLWAQLRQYLASQGVLMPELLFISGLLLVMIGALWAVAGRLLSDLSRQAKQRSRGNNK